MGEMFMGTRPGKRGTPVTPYPLGLCLYCGQVGWPRDVYEHCKRMHPGEPLAPWLEACRTSYP